MSLFVPRSLYNSLTDVVDKNNYMNKTDRQNNDVYIQSSKSNVDV
jgi:hypothetical protein